jgi:hypothetical protein
MREQSHIEAMREAIRGDRERARSRNPSIFERPSVAPVVAEPEAAPEPEPPAEVEPPEPAAAGASAAPASTPSAAVEPEPGPESEPKQGLLARLAFWRR